MLKKVSILHLIGAVILLGGCAASRSGLPGGGGAPRACEAPCENGGVCGAAGQCDCAAIDYDGPTCTDAIDDCASVDCDNGECMDAVRDFSCDCDSGWTIDADGLCTVKVVDCNTPSACIHGKCSIGSGEVRCDCDAGYMGNNCNALVNCGSPPEAPENATLVDATGTEFGDTVLYMCSPGYGDDSQEIECKAKGSWSSLNLTCSPVDCGPLSAPVQGSVDTSDGTAVGSVAVYECEPDYVLVGAETRTCHSSGNWTGNQPSCARENPCVDDPCVNGDCDNPSPGVFECDCDRGWQGSTCEQDIDECMGGLGPCNPEGTDACINEPGSFDCDCDSDHEGRLCHKLD